MATAEELARLHLEVAVKLTSKAFVSAWLGEATAPVPAPAPTPASASAQTQGHRGRKPGAAPDGERCEWTLVAGDRCKNRRLDTGSFCKIHVGKIHLVDPTD
jgi:hypothetical protein